jgi:aerobic-type carbon monoxide dehydrogenase small subunit (CoxS/CutS family)
LAGSSVAAPGLHSQPDSPRTTINPNTTDKRRVLIQTIESPVVSYLNFLPYFKMGAAGVESLAGVRKVNVNVSRRRFIKGVITSSAAAATSSAWYSASAKQRPGGVVERLITLNVNGRKRPVDVLPQETLAYTLRYKLGLTGTKLGCNRGECGACTVVVDDVSHYSCSMLTHSVRGRAVATVEGLQDPSGALHPVQQAFIDELAPQCGYCTPGQLMATVALLKDNPKPTREEARQALSGNLCRCGAYDHYLNAVMRASGQATEVEQNA